MGQSTSFTGQDISEAQKGGESCLKSHGWAWWSQDSAEADSRALTFPDPEASDLFPQRVRFSPTACGSQGSRATVGQVHPVPQDHTISHLRNLWSGGASPLCSVYLSFPVSKIGSHFLPSLPYYTSPIHPKLGGSFNDQRAQVGPRFEADM